MAYRVEAARSRVKRELRRIPRENRERIGRVVAALANDPRPGGAAQLQPDVYRIRAGEYRIIYKVFDDRELILVGRVARRGEDTYRGIGSLFD